MPLFLNEKMIQEMRKIQRTKSDKFLKIKHFHKLTLTVLLWLRGAFCGSLPAIFWQAFLSCEGQETPRKP